MSKMDDRTTDECKGLSRRCTEDAENDYNTREVWRPVQSVVLAEVRHLVQVMTASFHHHHHHHHHLSSHPLTFPYPSASCASDNRTWCTWNETLKTKVLFKSGSHSVCSAPQNFSCHNTRCRTMLVQTRDHNRTGTPCSVGCLTTHAPGGVKDSDRRLRQTPASKTILAH